MNCSKAERLFLGVADDNNSATAILGDSQGRVIARRVGGSVNYIRYGVPQARRNLEELVRASLGSRTPRVLDTVCFTYQCHQILDAHHLNCLIHGLFEGTNIAVSDFRSASILGLPQSRAQMLVIGGDTSYVFFRCPSGLRYEFRCPFSSWDIAIRTWKKIRQNPYAYGSGDLQEIFLDSSIALYNGRSSAIAQHINELAEMGNPIALEILCDAADDLIHSILRVVRYMDVLDPFIGLCGPILLGSEIIHNRVQRVIQLLLPQAEIMIAPHAPAKGAYLSSLKARRFRVNSEIIQNMFLTSRRLSLEGSRDYAAAVSYNG
ncbi:MAG: hypothetical protein GX331_02430 [Firmicutes bacterium]|nr:hypothetical protein [Bacillota bacterium]